MKSWPCWIQRSASRLLTSVRSTRVLPLGTVALSSSRYLALPRDASLVTVHQTPRAGWWACPIPSTRQSVRLLPGVFVHAAALAGERSLRLGVHQFRAGCAAHSSSWGCDVSLFQLGCRRALWLKITIVSRHRSVFSVFVSPDKLLLVIYLQLWYWPFEHWYNWLIQIFPLLLG